MCLRDADADVLAVTGMDTLELVSRLQRSDLDQATLDGLRLIADRLCSEYPFMPGDQLIVEGRAWLRRVVSFRGQRLTLNQHREIHTLAGWITLLIACVEYDSGDRQAAETTRRAAPSLGIEADHAGIRAWAHEIRAWIDLTTGNYHGVVAAAGALAQPAPGGVRAVGDPQAVAPAVFGLEEGELRAGVRPLRRAKTRIFPGQASSWSPSGRSGAARSAR
jgi:hypothetical protein